MVRFEQVDILYDQASAGLVMTLVVTLTLGTFLLIEEASVSTIGAWWLFTVLVVAWRWRLIQRFRSAKDAYSNSAVWGRRFVVGATLAGLVWGIFGAALAFEVPLLDQALILVVIAGMSSGAILLLGSSVAAYMGFTLVAGVPLLVWMFWQRDFIHLVIAILTCVFIAAAWVAVLKISRLLSQTLYLESKSKALADELQESEKIFKQAAHIASLGHFEWNELTGRCNFASDEYASILGMTVDEVHAQYNNCDKDILLIHPDDRERIASIYTEYQKQGGSYDVEYRIIRPDGEERRLREMWDPVVDDQGKLIRTIGILQDITEHANLRKNIEESAAKLKLAARTAKLGYWHFDDVVNEFLDVSEEFAEIYGYTASEFLDRFLTLDDDMKTVHPEDREALCEAYELVTGKADFEYRMQHKDGHWIHVREISTEIRDKAGKYIQSIGTLQDISELKEAQLKAERANQAKNEFLSSMSHELRTPLNAILGFSQLIESDQSLDKQQQSKATAIFNAGQHLLNLINDVLELSLLEAGNIETSIKEVSLEAVIEDSTSLVANMAESRSVTIDCNLGNCRGLMVEADEVRLKQVFLNLLSNAVKYNREGGRVSINFALDGSGLVSVSIKDTGPGIAPERIGELFEPFNRLGAELSGTEGTGIGLVISRQLVELMQGELRVDSNPGEGSTFTVRFKAIQANSTDIDTLDIELNSANPQFADSNATRPRILVAEDDPVNQELLAEQLDFLGYCVDFATTGVEALALWTSGNYPLLLTDIRMPEMNGYELISQIRALESDISKRPIIAVTASAMESDVEQCLSSGADDVISKPLVLDGLKQVLENWMPRQIADDPG